MSPVPTLKGNTVIATVVSVVVLIALCLVLWMFRNTPPLSGLLGATATTTPALPGAQPIATVAYTCDQGKHLIAQYYDGTSSTAADGRPIPGGRVVLTLTDGSVKGLDQTLSADGTRYANTDESFIFWSKGNGAFVEEGSNQSQTYTNCIGQ